MEDRPLRNCIEGMVRIHRDVSNSSYAPEYDVAGILDPFLHIRVLKLMHILGQGDADCSDYMNDILAQICCSEHTYDGIIVDTQAVQRHRVSILECVKDADAPIRKRALELVYLLVNDTNVKLLTKKLVDYLKVANPDFKEDLRAKICSMAEKFSQEKLWYLDQMFKVLSLSWHMLKETL
ncbi:AP-1 complex subunit gamma-2-like isoform X3 [Hordeum vulgare subsp. vulgare]|uniref:AP-1 complex subunit gamma-2-like isoform X3 n=1 Tax=Hordeum vulgare subsp. vulgare TaxID=112509 RepID=UPI000B46972E|nr:AP-1 complex subunit gamma-2-like isoform X3 [Hordeum vulgare subsp. vulgare]